MQTTGDVTRTLLLLKFEKQNVQSQFVSGSEFNKKISKLSSVSYYTSFTKSSSAPNISSMSTNNFVSTSESDSPIYVWKNGTNLY